jgi:hypothetical protein
MITKSGNVVPMPETDAEAEDCLPGDENGPYIRLYRLLRERMGFSIEDAMYRVFQSVTEVK